MPIALIYLGQKQSDELKAELAKEAMKILSEVIGKPIQYCSSQVLESVGGFGGNAEPSVFIDIKSIGGLKGKQKDLSDKFCTLIENKTLNKMFATVVRLNKVFDGENIDPLKDEEERKRINLTWKKIKISFI